MTPSSAIILENICLVAYIEGAQASPFTFKRGKREHDRNSSKVHDMLRQNIIGVIYCPWCGNTIKS